MIVPERIRLGQVRVVELRADPAMGFSVAVREGEIGLLTVDVAGDMITVVAIHVHSELGTANAERVDLTEDEERARLGHLGRLHEDSVACIRLLVIDGAFPREERVHPVAARSEESLGPLSNRFFVTRAAKAVF